MSFIESVIRKLSLKRKGNKFIVNDKTTETILKKLDTNYKKIKRSSRKNKEWLQNAIMYGWGDDMYYAISKCYGQLEELICLHGPHRAQSILVFKHGIGILAGSNSALEILTWGYNGQGPRAMSKFLKAAKFEKYQASEFEVAMIVRKDGTIIKGEFDRDTMLIQWETGGRMRYPDYNA